MLRETDKKMSRVLAREYDIFPGDYLLLMSRNYVLEIICGERALRNARAADNNNRSRIYTFNVLRVHDRRRLVLPTLLMIYLRRTGYTFPFTTSVLL